MSTQISLETWDIHSAKLVLSCLERYVTNEEGRSYVGLRQLWLSVGFTVFIYIHAVVVTVPVLILRVILGVKVGGELRRFGAEVGLIRGFGGVVVVKAGWFRLDAVYYSGNDSGMAMFSADLIATGGAS